MQLNDVSLPEMFFDRRMSLSGGHAQLAFCAWKEAMALDDRESADAAVVAAMWLEYLRKDQECRVLTVKAVCEPGTLAMWAVLTLRGGGSLSMPFSRLSEAGRLHVTSVGGIDYSPLWRPAPSLFGGGSPMAISNLGNMLTVGEMKAALCLLAKPDVRYQERMLRQFKRVAAEWQ